MAPYGRNVTESQHKSIRASPDSDSRIYRCGNLLSLWICFGKLVRPRAAKAHAATAGA
jgi:hypothetical protein